MSAWSQRLRVGAASLRRLAARYEEDPFLVVYHSLDEIWRGPAANELTAEAAAQDASLEEVGGGLRAIAAGLDRQAAEIEAAERGDAGVTGAGLAPGTIR